MVIVVFIVWACCENGNSLTDMRTECAVCNREIGERTVDGKEQIAQIAQKTLTDGATVGWQRRNRSCQFRSSGCSVEGTYR